MATMKFFNVLDVPVEGADDGTYYVKNGDRVSTYIVSGGKVIPSDVDLSGYAHITDLELKANQTDLVQLESDVEQLAYVKIKNEAVNGNFENGLIAPFYRDDGSVGGTSTLAINSSTPISGNYDSRLTIITPGGPTRPFLAGLNRAGNIGDKIYLHFDAKILSSTPIIRGVHDGITLSTIYAGDVINGRNTRIIDVMGTGVNLGLIYFNSESVWDMQMDNFMRINLTETFGAGNEPTEGEMNLLLDMLPVDYFEGEITIPAQKIMQWQLKLIRVQTLENIEVLNMIFKGGQLEIKSLIADAENQKSRWIELKDNYDFPSKGIFIGRQNEDVVISINGVITKLNS